MPTAICFYFILLRYDMNKATTLKEIMKKEKDTYLQLHNHKPPSMAWRSSFRLSPPPCALWDQIFSVGCLCVFLSHFSSGEFWLSFQDPAQTGSFPSYIHGSAELLRSHRTLFPALLPHKAQGGGKLSVFLTILHAWANALLIFLCISKTHTLTAESRGKGMKWLQSWCM